MTWMRKIYCSLQDHGQPQKDAVFYMPVHGLLLLWLRVHVQWLHIPGFPDGEQKIFPDVRRKTLALLQDIRY